MFPCITFKSRYQYYSASAFLLTQYYNFEGFSKEFCDVTLKMLNLQIKHKEKMIKMCDDPDVKVEQLEALDPISKISLKIFAIYLWLILS